MRKSNGMKIHDAKVCLCKSTAIALINVQLYIFHFISKQVSRQIYKLKLQSFTTKDGKVNVAMLCSSNDILQGDNADKSHASACHTAKFTKTEALLLYHITPAN